MLITTIALLIGATPAPIAPVEATVASVIDGDTIEVTVNGGTERVRLIGIDAPELDTCGGPEAREHLAALLAVGTVVLTEGGDGEDRDQYDRLLRYVTDGTPGPGFDAGRSMLTDGYAIARYDSRDGYGRHWLEDTYVEADESSADAMAAICGPTEEPIDAGGSDREPWDEEVASNAVLGHYDEEPVEDSGLAHYSNCTDVRAAGAAPIHLGDAGWQDKFDRDNDGVGCE